MVINILLQGPSPMSLPNPKIWFTLPASQDAYYLEAMYFFVGGGQAREGGMGKSGRVGWTNKQTSILSDQ